MKQFILNIAILSFLFFAPSLKAQDDSKYGDNPDQCKRDLSEYIEFIKQKSYVDALPAWRRVYTACPQSSKSIYINGPKIYKAMIKKDAANKLAYLDTIMQIYDKRIEYFGQEGNVIGRKGNDLYRYNKKAYEEAYGYLKKSADLMGSKAQPAILQQYMAVSSDMYKNKKIDAGQVVADFSKISDALTAILERLQDKPAKLEKIKKVEENVGKLFIATGAGSCDVLVEHFTPKFNQTPKDIELLKTITKYLDKGDCTDSKLFFDASVNLYELEPSAIAAYNIAKMAAKKKEFSKAADFYKKAIEMEENDENKAQYYYELAAVSIKTPSVSRGYARKAAALKPGWGAPYILIGKLYAGAANTCGEDKFTKSSVYWLAVDIFIKAKSIDSSVAEEANKLIATYKAYFPGKEDAFAYNVTEGAPVKIECWINETTKARF